MFEFLMFKFLFCKYAAKDSCTDNSKINDECSVLSLTEILQDFVSQKKFNVIFGSCIFAVVLLSYI